MFKGMFEFIKALINFRDYIAKVSNLERKLIELDFYFSEIKKRTDKLENIINDLKTGNDSGGKEKPFPISREDIVYQDNLLWLKGESAPYCPNCFEANDKLIHMQSIDRTFATTSGSMSYKYFDCPNCNYRTKHVAH